MSRLLLFLPVVASLKLTPVQQLTQRVDLSNEVQTTTVTLNNALSTFEQLELISEIDLKDFLESPEIQKLYSVIRRWSYIEERLKISMSSGSLSQQTLQLEDVQHNVASMKVLLGHTFYRRKDEKTAISELEAGCPTLWKLKASWRSISHDGWLDCFATLGEYYLSQGKREDVQIIADKLVRSNPWIYLVLKIAKEETTIEVLKAFIALSSEDRKVIAMEVKGAWTFVEGIRNSFKLLMDEFIGSESSRKRQTIVNRARRVTQEILQQYNQEPLSQAASLVSSLSSINLEALRNYLSQEIAKETNLFLTSMTGYITSGEDYVKELKQQDLSSHLKTSFETLTAVLESGHDLSWAQLHAREFLEDRTGFLEIGDLVPVFEQAIERQKVMKAEESEKARRQQQQQQQQKSRQYAKSSKSDKTSKRSSRSTSSSNRPGYNDTTGKKREAERGEYEEEGEAKTWLESIIEWLWSLLVGGGVLSIVSILGGHYLRSSNTPTRPPHRPNRVFVRPPAAISNHYRRSQATSSSLVPPPRFDSTEDIDQHSTQWWMNLMEDSKVFWRECFAITVLVWKLLRETMKTAVGKGKGLYQATVIASSSSSTTTSRESSEESNHSRRSRERTDTEESSLNPLSLFSTGYYNSTSTEFVEFDLTLSPDKTRSHKRSKSSQQTSKKKRRTANQKKEKSKDDLERSNSLDRQEGKDREARDAVQEKNNEENEDDSSSSDSEYLDTLYKTQASSSLASDRVKEASRKVELPPLEVTVEDDIHYFPEEFDSFDDGEWIEAGGKKSTPHHTSQTGTPFGLSSTTRRSSPHSGYSSRSGPTSPDRHYLQLREQRQQKELQRRKAFETDFINGKLDHAPKGLKKVTPANSTVQSKPVVGMATSASTIATTATASSVSSVKGRKLKKQEVIHDMLRVSQAFAAANAQVNGRVGPDISSSSKTGDSSSETIQHPQQQQQQQQQNHQQFMSMMYSLLDRHQTALQQTPSHQSPPSTEMTTYEKSGLKSDRSDENDGEHSSLTDTERSEDPYQIDRSTIYPAEFMEGRTSDLPLPTSEAELNKFYSIMNAYYHYHATDSLIPWNSHPEDSSPSPDLVVDSPMHPPTRLAGMPSLETMPSFDPNTMMPVLIPPPLIPVSPEAVEAANQGKNPSPPVAPNAPPLLIPPLMQIPPPLASPQFPLPPPVFPLGLPPMPLPFVIPPPPPVYRSPAMLLEATQKQIEYYFSEQNLVHDIYLRQLMDEDGFVSLSFIAKFPRIILMNVPSDMLLAAVQTSQVLEIKVVSPSPLPEGMKLNTEELIECTLIRCQEHPEQWVLYPESFEEQ